MDTRITDRTHFVLALAREAANSRHQQVIETEHILYGLIMEGYGVAANVLRRLDATFDVPVRQGPAGNEELLIEGRAELRRLCGEAKELMDCASEQARSCYEKWPNPQTSGPYVGTEHVLMALAKNAGTRGAKLLEEELSTAGMTLDELRRYVLQFIGIGQIDQPANG